MRPTFPRTAVVRALCVFLLLSSAPPCLAEEATGKRKGFPSLFKSFPNLRGKERNRPADEAPTGSRCSPAEARTLIEFHNRVRAEVRVGEISWSETIAAFAQERAETIARTRRLAHLTRGQNPYGENLALGGGVGFGVAAACEGWYAERARMPPGANLLTASLFARGVGHYTQMVWGETARIGAGIARYEEGGMTMTVVVCCYDPPGNRIGGTIR
jgi:pathogenesis-related protein 1